LEGGDVDVDVDVGGMEDVDMMSMEIFGRIWSDGE